MEEKHQVVLVIVLFALIVAGIVASIFLNSNVPEAKYERYEQSNRLERIKKGFVDK